MSTSATTAATETPFTTFLSQCDEAAWKTAVNKLSPSIHQVDKSATRIWFSFYPLSLFKALIESEDPDNLARELLFQGEYRLTSQIDSSHHFLYGHRYWPQIKSAVERHAAEWNNFSQSEDYAASLVDQIHAV